MSFTQTNFAQLDEILNSELLKRTETIYNYSTPLSQTIEVKLWGVINKPGGYKIDKGTTLLKLLTFAGGLTEAVELDEIRIIRLVANTKYETIIIDYEKILDGNELNISEEMQYKLLDGDVIFLPKSTTWYQSILPVTTIVSAITSVVTLVLLLNRNNK